MGLDGRHLVWQADLLLRRAARRRRRALERELAEYRTTGDRADLLAAVDRCTSPAAEEVRRVLARVSARADGELTPYDLRRY